VLRWQGAQELLITGSVGITHYREHVTGS